MVVVSIGELCHGVDEADGCAEVLELEHLLDLVPFALPVTELVEALLDLFVPQQFGHGFSLGSASFVAEDTAPPVLLRGRNVVTEAPRRGRKPARVVLRPEGPKESPGGAKGKGPYTRPEVGAGAGRVMRYGIGIAGPMTELGLRARAAEAAGFESCWVDETTHSAFVSAAAAICSTSQISVGCAVALAFPRSPTITAMSAWDLDELSGGRFVLGLGSQVKGVLEGRFSIPFQAPAPKLREYVLAVKTIWAANRGEDVDFRGRFYDITLPSFHAEPQPRRPLPPVVLAAVGPGMCRMCGEIADGLVAHPLASPEYLARVVGPAIEQGAARAGRVAGDCPVTATVIASISNDADLARREAKLQIAFYATTRSYSGILALHGRANIVPDLRAAFAARDRDRMIALVDDELCDAISAAGPADEVLARLQRWDGVADRVTVTGPWYGPAPERRAENQAALVQTVGARS